MVNDGSVAIFPILYPILISSFSFTTATTGVLAGFLYASSLIASPFIGRRSDYNRNYFGLLSFGLVAVASGIVGYGFCLAFVHSTGWVFWILILVTIVSGFGSSFYHPIGAAILDQNWPASTRGRAMGISGSLGAVGNLAFPIIADFLIFSFGSLYLAVLGLAAIVITFAIYFGIRNTSSRDTPTTTSSQGPSSATRVRRRQVPFKSVLTTVFVLTIIAFLRSFFTTGVMQFIPTYLNRVDNIPQAFLGYAVASISITGIISQPIFGHFGDRMGRRLAIAVTTVGASISIILFLLSTGLVETELSLALFGFFQYTSFPLLLAMSSEIAPEGATTLSNSIVWGLGTTGGASLGPIVIGIMASGSVGSLSLAFLITSLIGLASVTLLPFVKKRRAVGINLKGKVTSDL